MNGYVLLLTSATLLACTMMEAVHSQIWFDGIQHSWVEGNRISVAANINFSYYGNGAPHILTCSVDESYCTTNLQSWPAEWNVTVTNNGSIEDMVLSMKIELTATKSLNGKKLLCKTICQTALTETKECSAWFVFNMTSDTSDPPTPFQSQSTSATSHTAAGNSVTGPASNTVQILYSSKSNEITAPRLWIFAIMTLMSFAVF